MRALIKIGSGKTHDGVFERPAVDTGVEDNTLSFDVVSGQSHLFRVNVAVSGFEEGNIPSNVNVDVIPSPGRAIGNVLGFKSGRMYKLSGEGDIYLVSIVIPHQEKVKE
jgi:hypothetical protein